MFKNFITMRYFFLSFDNSLKLLNKVFFIFFFQSTWLELPLKQHTQKGCHQAQDILFFVVEFFLAWWQYKDHYCKALWYIHWFFMHVFKSHGINIHFYVKLYLHAYVSKYWFVLRYRFSYNGDQYLYLFVIYVVTHDWNYVSITRNYECNCC